MGFSWGDVLGGVGDAFSSIGGLAADALTGGGWSAQEANKTNVELAHQNRDWAEKMSNSAYQRAMTDMKAAGLNPMLAYQQGGASTPSVATPEVQATKMGAGLANTAKSALEMMATNQNTKKAKSETELNTENLKTQKTVQQLNNAQTEKQTWSARESEENINNKAAQTQLIHKQREEANHRIREAKADADAATMNTDLQRGRYGVDKALAPYDAVGQRAGKILDKLKGLLPFSGKSVDKIYPTPKGWNDNELDPRDRPRPGLHDRSNRESKRIFGR
jgi:hypothetical protein